MSIHKTPTEQQLNSVIQKITQAGFPYIKVEFEAQFDREQQSRCERCGGTEFNQCVDCSGRGIVLTSPDDMPANTMPRVEACASCRGYGGTVCEHVASNPNLMTDGGCIDFINSRIVADREFLNYIRFYRDGSCDSELTFTLPVSEIRRIPNIMKAFTAIGEETGFCDIRGSGIHIALMRDSVYPARQRINKDFNWFEFNMTRLLPALYFLGASNRNTRSIEMRLPRIGRGTDRHNDKYSAIYTKGDTVIEYRVFETCYANPSMIFDYIAVIANTLKYFEEDNFVPVYNHEFLFKEGNSLTRFYDSEKALKVLYRQVKLLKPEWKTLEDLKRERRFDRIDTKRLDMRNKMKDQLMRERFAQATSKETRSPRGPKLLKALRQELKLNDIQAAKLYLKPKEASYMLYKARSEREIRWRVST